MFYEHQPASQQENYKKMLAAVGNLTQLFSESDCPYLPYRAHENIFCKYFQAENLARHDCSADAKKHRIGIGLKTWMGQDDQKVAEFGRLRETFEGLKGMKLVRKIADYRNERIRITKNLHGIDEMVYHIVRRIPGAMEILEHAFDYIDVEHLSLIPDRGNVNNTYFTDGRHTYHFNSSKNTLYMIFEDMECLDRFDVEIMDDPYSFLMHLMYPGEESLAEKEPQAVKESQVKDVPQAEEDTQVRDAAAEFLRPAETVALPQICLRLYSTRSGTKFVAERSGLNQWNAKGRPRDPDELYIPYPAEDRNRNSDFFPGRDTIFSLRLPDGQVISAKICQEAGKAIMSNPNRDLGKWLLRTVFELPEWTLVTYEMLLRFGVDSVIFTKHGELDYSVDFAEVGTYEEFYDLERDWAE